MVGLALTGSDVRYRSSFRADKLQLDVVTTDPWRRHLVKAINPRIINATFPPDYRVIMFIRYLTPIDV